jgi:hypothetical protein
VLVTLGDALRPVHVVGPGMMRPLSKARTLVMLLGAINESWLPSNPERRSLATGWTEAAATGSGRPSWECQAYPTESQPIQRNPNQTVTHSVGSSVLCSAMMRASTRPFFEQSDTDSVKMEGDEK